jgi:XTP/dITP diphosphohydrolase
LVLYFASTNLGKLLEFRQAAQTCGITIDPVPGMNDLPPCVEDGLTFEENAGKKALYYCAQTEGLVFADDSGICVDALGGAPGIYSARFAGATATNELNNEKLLAELRRAETTRAGRTAVPASVGRAAHYLGVIALAERGRILTTVEGRVDGIILNSPRGKGGFGYDPLFFFPPLGKTFAELDSEEKFKVSHRGHAFRKLLEFLAHA